MNWDYEYNKSVIADVLDDMIKFNSLLRPKYIGVLSNATAIICRFSEALTPDEHDTLNVIVDSYSDTHELVVRKGIEENVMTPAMIYGNNFLAKFSANNLYRNKTPIQIGTLLATYPDLIHAAITGSLTALYGTMLTMVADANISQEEIDEFKLRLELHLGLI